MHIHKYIYDNEAFKELASDVTTSELFYYIDVLVDVQNKIRFTNSQKIYLEVGVMKIINSASEDIDVLSKIHKLEEVVGEKETKDGFVNNQDLDNKFTNLDNRIKKVATDLEKAKIDEFKEKIATISENAVGDACTGSNPRTIDPATMERLFTCIYYGTEVDF